MCLTKKISAKIIAGILILSTVLYLLHPIALAYDTRSVETDVSISAGHDLTYVVKENGSLWAWGRNNYGQLGTGSTDDLISPVQILDDVVSVSASSTYYATAVKKDGSLWEWGDGRYGQIKNSLIPVKVMDDVVSVSAGYNHTVAIKTDGSLWAWGADTDGQLGDSENSTGYNPIHVMDDVIMASAGDFHTMAIKKDGTLWAWGLNEHGQLGNGTTISSNTPTRIMDNVEMVSAGHGYTLAIKKDGTLWGWGWNVHGMLGNGTSVDSHTPVKIMDNVKFVSANSYHATAIKNDSSLWSWGSDSNGSLGNGSNGSQNTPVHILNDVVATSAGDFHSVAVKNDGSLYAWGWNRYGALGNGTTIDSDVPIHIMDGIYAPIVDENDDQLQTIKPFIYKEEVGLDYKGWDWFPDKSVPPFPDDGSTNDYRDELIGWASEFGYSLSKDDAKNSLDKIVYTPVFLENGHIVFDAESDRTVRQVMEDIIMLGNLQEYLIAEEYNLKNNPNKSEIQDSFENMKLYLERYYDYINNEPVYAQQIDLVLEGLLHTSHLIDTTKNDYNFDFTISSRFAKMKLEPTEVMQEILDGLASANKREQEEAKELWSTIIENGTSLYEGNYGDVAYSIFESSLSSNKNAKTIFDTLSFAKSVISLAGGKAFPFTSAVSKLYYDNVMEPLMNLTKDKITSWLFYSNYYMAFQSPDTYSKIEFLPDGTIPNWTDGTLSISATSDADALSKALVDMFNETFGIFGGYMQEDYPSESAEAISFAMQLATIRHTDYRDIQEALVKYVISENANACVLSNVSCPVDVSLLDENGHVVFTLENGDDFEENYNDYCTFYLTGDNKDEKTLIYPQGYSLVVTPYDDGTMKIKTQSPKSDGSETTDVYNEIAISVGEVYYVASNISDSQSIVVTKKDVGLISPDISVNYPTKIEVVQDKSTYNINDIITLEVFMQGVSASDSDYFVSTSSTDVISIDENGVISAIGYGNALITISSSVNDDIKQSLEVAVVPMESDEVDIGISFDLEMGRVYARSSILDSGAYYLNEEIKIAAYPELGYEFVGWTTSNGGTFDNYLNPIATFTVPPDDTTIIANFKEEDQVYTISFDTNVLDIKVSDQKTNNYKLESIPTISRSGYIFEGWFTDKNYTTKIDENTVFEMNTTVYAKWIDNYTPNPPITDNANTEEDGDEETRNEDNLDIYEDKLSNLTDISDHWANEGIKFIVEKGLMNGVSKTLFAPNEKMTRSMIWTVLARNAGINTENSQPWYQEGMEWVKTNNISDGSNPNDEITREQIVVMLYRLSGSPKTSSNRYLDFDDNFEVSSWAIDAFNWAITEEVISGKNEKILDPKGKATRAEVATILMRYLSN